MEQAKPQLIDMNEAARMLGSRATLFRRIAKPPPGFPRRIIDQNDRRRKYFVKLELEKWLSDMPREMR